ncbi:ribonuclease III domain-containing protein [Cristinia sonorae]|uniref:Ribonuclease III domain-containing protein n=1 Tax=Cristinia sonorae TaxID=1940300 RepID=A0A8K0XNX3_9AGAR|nr:ribonuclease III domain-containing protein [Cristinia sonorae]
MDPPVSIPRLSGDIILEVFTHRSLRFAGAPANEDSEYGDNDRLAFLGDKAFDLAVTDALFRKRPMLSAEELENQKAEWTSSTAIENWVTGYKLRDKLRFGREYADSIREANETRHLFFSYVGAVFAQQGVQAVLDWIGRLVDPDYEPASPEASSMDQSFSFKKPRVEPQQPYIPQMQPIQQQQYNAQFAPDVPQFAPPPPPSNPPPPLPQNPLAPAQPHSSFLPMFNQTATQRRIPVDYPATFSGPAHAGRWTVKCIVNGIEKGQGHGASKQLAKEEAARQAYYAMGWAPRGL